MLVAIIEQWMDDDRQCTLKGLVMHTGIYGSTVPQIFLKMHNFAARYDVHQWTCYEICRISLEQFFRKRGSMFNQVTVFNETWARACEPELKTVVIQIESSTFTVKVRSWTKSVAHKTDDHFGI
jgi:hypothetical protein